MYFVNYRLQKRSLDKCLKNPVSEEPYIRNTRNGPKHCGNLEDGTFTISGNHCEHNSVGKSLC